jgi:hypothetical protein
MKYLIYVIPGTRYQGEAWVREQCYKRFNAGENNVSPSEYVIIPEGSVDRLRGLREPHGVFIGSWRRRSDLHDICIQLNLCHSYRNPAIHKIMREELGY